MHEPLPSSDPTPQIRQMQTPDPSLVKDVTLAQAGDRDALNRLFDRFEKRIMGVIIRMVRDKPAAEDVLMLSMAKAWRRIRQLHDPASFDNWWETIARHEAITELNKRKRRRETGTEVTNSDGDTYDRFDILPTDGPSLEDEVINRITSTEVLDTVLWARSKIRQDFDEIIRLKESGMTGPEIAEVMGLASAEAARTMLTRARQALEEMAIRYGSAAVREWFEERD